MSSRGAIQCLYIKAVKMKINIESNTAGKSLNVVCSLDMRMTRSRKTFIWLRVMDIFDSSLTWWSYQERRDFEA